jgi:hypothetical protein
MEVLLILVNFVILLILKDMRHGLLKMFIAVVHKGDSSHAWWTP